MVKAVIDIKEETNKILNIIKAKYGLKDKSSAIDKLVEEYAKQVLEPGLKPEKKKAGSPSNNSSPTQEKVKVHYVG